MKIHAPAGIGDAWFFTDHLHPGVVGYRAIADRFFEALRTHPALRLGGVVPAREEAAAPPELHRRDHLQERIVWLSRRLADPFERLYAHLQVFSIHAGYPFSNASPDEERVLLERQLGRVRTSRSYLDFLTYQTMVRALPPADAVALAVTTARARGDTLYALQLYRSALAWQPFDTTLHREAAGYAFEMARADPAYQPLAEQILFRIAQLEHAPHSLSALATLRLQRGDATAAAILLNLAETRTPGRCRRPRVAGRRGLSAGRSCPDRLPGCRDDQSTAVRIQARPIMMKNKVAGGLLGVMTCLVACTAGDGGPYTWHEGDGYRWADLHTPRPRRPRLRPPSTPSRPASPSSTPSPRRPTFRTGTT
ncbi:MAG: hypothetical protein KatS3mg043_1076 [Rhodothermaceae bacterium]|nr:MAG: hypothetical protein KatS3mg043_1076 [Rhodothermaceae bacterium]